MSHGRVPHLRALRALAVAALVLLPCARALALDPDRALSQCLHRIWQVQQGLPQAAIYAVRAASDGYLWLGTRTGLVRFDGVRFVSIDDAGGAPIGGVWVRDLLEAPDHALWIGTAGAGLLRLRDGAMSGFSVADGLPSMTVQCLVHAADGALWVGTSDGMARVVDGKITTYRAGQGLASADVRAACVAGDGTLWVGGDGPALSRWDGSRFHAVTLTSIPSNASVMALIEAPDGDLWVGTTSGLLRVRGGRETCFTVADGLADASIECLAPGSNGSLWVGTRNGFSRVRDGEIESFRAGDGLSQSTVYTLCEDREGSLWVGTKHGLNQFLDRRTVPFTVREGLPSNDTGPILQDGAGAIWVGTLGAGLSRFDGRRFAPVRSPDAGMQSILSLADAGDGGLWVGSPMGVRELRDGSISRTYRQGDGLPAADVRCLLRDREGALWAGTGAGLAVIRDGKVTAIGGDLPAARAPILAIVQRRDGSIVAATEGGGLLRWAGGRLEATAPEGPAPRDVDAFYEDQDGLLWMGTIGAGLRVRDGARFFDFSMQDGLFDDEIYGIVPGPGDTLWMACSKGVFCVSRKDLRRFEGGQIESFASTPFSPTDALRTIECKPGVQPAAWAMRDGRLWFSTIRGVIVIDPSHLRRKVPSPPVVIEEVTVNGRSEPPDAVAALPPGLTNLEFRYTCLSFLSPERITFRYRLEGFDRDWVEAGPRREAFYTNLPPGRYRFRVKARDIDGAEDEAANPVAFTIASHYYQRAWFWPLQAAVAGLGALLIVRLRIARIQAQWRAILSERSRIARELHDTLLQGFSGVTMEMQALSARLAPSQERETLADIIGDAGACMREARRSVAGLRSAQGAEMGLAAAIAKAAREATEGRSVQLALRLDEAPRGLAPPIELHLLRIGQEAVLNAVRHAGARVIEVTLRAEAGALRLSVRDDGSGFVDDGSKGAAAGHYGIMGMRERAAEIGAELRIASEPGRGTTVDVAVPARRAPPGEAMGREV